MAFRRLSFASETTDLGENDDEAEKEERRSKDSNSSNSFNASVPSTIVNLSPEEMNNQIDQCLKLNAANKINDKNAFQLKMIDFLVYALKKQNPKFSNLQMASACLDVSGKIYGFRVDKVHSDVLKIVGATRGEKRPHENEDENLWNQDANGNVINQPRKKRRRQHNLLLSVEALRGNIETYNPLSMLDNQVDTQTSDCLHQARLPKHANQGISLNLYNDVVLDRIPVNIYNFTNFLVPKIVDYTSGQLCPSYKAFKFLGWTVEDESMDNSEPKDTRETNNESDVDYHFNMDDPIVEEDKIKSIMDYRDNQEEIFNGIAQNENQEQQQLDDFQDIIANNPNPDATYEYSYIQENHSIRLVRPSYWRLHIKRDVRYIGAVGSPRKVRRKKEIKLQYAGDAKEEADSRFVLANRSPKLLKATYMNWSKDHIILPNFMLPHFMQYDKNRFCSYFTSDKKMNVLDSHGKIENKEEDMRESQDDMSNFNLSNFGNAFQNNEDFQLNLDDSENQLPDHSFMFPDSEPPSQQPNHESFIGENLVSLPKLTDNVFIPYSQQAKKIDMRQLKKSIHHILNNKETKEFSQLYRELPAKLSKVNAQSLSPGLAFMSILHVSHEEKLILKSHLNYADVKIRHCEIFQQ